MIINFPLLTQKDLTAQLERTAASISDLERGKVQVTANDLYKISQYLKKPIEYFYGEDFGGDKIQDLVSLLHSQSKEYRRDNIEYIQKTIKLQILGNSISNKSDEEITAEQIKEFLELLVDLTNKNKSASIQVENATRRVLSEIEFKGIDFGEYLSKLNSLS